jgi:uncharacterized protein (TIGR02147 family)
MPMRRKKTVNIYEYLDYRRYLKDYYTHEKKVTRGFTFRSFAQKASVAPSLLKDIISDRQNLTLLTMQKYAAAMGLSPREQEYFSLLVKHNNCKHELERNERLAELVRLRAKSQIKVLTAKQYEYFSNWYHAAVREMVTHKGMGDNPEEIAKLIYPQITPYKVRKSIELLKELDLIYLDTTGVWRSRDRIVVSEQQVHSLSLKKYHDEMIELGRQSIDRFPSELREIEGLTLSSSKELYEEIRGRMQVFSEEILGLVAGEQCTAEKVFQLNLQLFPLTVDGIGEKP